MTKRKCDSTEEDRMKQLIICELCHETLEVPIMLPCGNTICSKHLLDEEDNFKCGVCEKTHDKTIEFPANKICDGYIDLNSFALGKEYNSAKNQCKHLNDLINESELLIKDPAFYKEIETKCKKNAQNKESRSKLEQTIKSTKKRLNEWIETLESKLNLESCCPDISNKSRQSIKELEYEINKCQQI